VQSLYGPGQALVLQEFEASRISRQSAHGGAKVVSRIHRPPAPPGNILGTRVYQRLCRGSTVQTERLRKRKITTRDFSGLQRSALAAPPPAALDL